MEPPKHNESCMGTTGLGVQQLAFATPLLREGNEERGLEARNEEIIKERN